ncbi:hypothetical protein GCM10009727_48540 [Actinomadura napierensis]|uniref:Uncharacterized protein n=1 Tax=Actinomadura napierensis TaxID=267854 RepID=A0ABN2ZSR7_9ACTN
MTVLNSPDHHFGRGARQPERPDGATTSEPIGSRLTHALFGDEAISEARTQSLRSRTREAQCFATSNHLKEQQVLADLFRRSPALKVSQRWSSATATPCCAPPDMAPAAHALLDH